MLLDKVCVSVLENVEIRVNEVNSLIHELIHMMMFVVEKHESTLY